MVTRAIAGTTDSHGPAARRMGRRRRHPNGLPRPQRDLGERQVPSGTRQAPDLDLGSARRPSARAPTCTPATPSSRDEYGLLPARYLVEHWFSWAAVERWPQLATRLRASEQIAAESRDCAERRVAAAERLGKVTS